MTKAREIAELGQKLTVDGSGNLGFSGDIELGDNNKAVFGAGSDLQIYHDGMHSYIEESGGTGNLQIRSDSIINIAKSPFEYMASFNADGAVQLYYDNDEKLATSSIGISVTGTVTADGLTVDGTTDSTEELARFGNNAGTQELIIEQAGSTGYAIKSSVDLRLYADYDSDTSDAGSNIEMYTDGTQRMSIIGSTGNVGIGEQEPHVRLHVKDGDSGSTGNSAGQVFVEGNTSAGISIGSATTNSSYVWFGDSDNIAIGRIRYDNQSDIFEFRAGNVDDLLVISGSNGVIINEASVDRDFRVESDSATHMLFVDASTNRVGINDSAPAYTLDVGASSSGTLVAARLHNKNTTSGSGVALKLQNTAFGGLNEGEIRYTNNGGNNNNNLSFHGEISGSNGLVQLGAFEGGGGQWVTQRGAVFNESGIDSDFRVESNTNTHMLFVDAGNNRVGINDSSPSQTLTVVSSDTNASRFYGAGGHGLYSYHDGGGTGWATGTGTGYDNLLYLDETNDKIELYTGGLKRVDVGAGAIVFNEIGADTDFRVESDGNNNMLLVNAASNKVSIGMSGGSEVFNVRGSIQLDHEGTDGFAKIVGPDNRTLKVVLRANDDNDAFLVEDDRSSGSERLTVNAGGEMVVNDTSADYDFRVESNTLAHALFVDGASGRIFAGSNVGSFSARLTVHRDSYSIESRSTGTGSEGHVAFRNANGAVGSIFTNGTVTAYNTSSDQRLKENIADADDAGELVDAIQVRQFDWKADGSHQKYGMVAQELNTVAPEAVSEGETEKDMMGVDYSKLVPMLVKEIQSLRERVAQLENA